MIAASLAEWLGVEPEEIVESDHIRLTLDQAKLLAWLLEEGRGEIEMALALAAIRAELDRRRGYDGPEPMDYILNAVHNVPYDPEMGAQVWDAATPTTPRNFD